MTSALRDRQCLEGIEGKWKVQGEDKDAHESRDGHKRL